VTIISSRQEPLRPGWNWKRIRDQAKDCSIGPIPAFQTRSLSTC